MIDVDVNGDLAEDVSSETFGAWNMVASGTDKLTERMVACVLNNICVPIALAATEDAVRLIVFLSPEERVLEFRDLSRRSCLLNTDVWRHF